jgi:hypothetical protein
MVFRKRKNPTPDFKLPPPYQPMSGQRAALQVPGIFPYCVLMQVAAEDEYDDYVLCRGFDPRINKFIDYEKDNEEKPGIPVAKPYSFRFKGLYEIAHLYAAALPVQCSANSPVDAKIRLGQNPGEAQESPGQPADLEEEVDELYDEDGRAVNWMFIESPGELIWGMLMEDHPGQYECFNILKGKWCPSEAKFLFDCDAESSTYLKAIDLHYTVSAGGSIPEPDAGAQGWFKLMSLGSSEGNEVIAVVVSLDCDSPGACATQDLDLDEDGECPTPDGDPCGD